MIYDPALTRGVGQTFIIGKSQSYSAWNIQPYDWIQFLADTAGACLAAYFILLALYLTAFPFQKFWSMEIATQVYRESATESTPID